MEKMKLVRDWVFKFVGVDFGVIMRLKCKFRFWDEFLLDL